MKNEHKHYGHDESNVGDIPVIDWSDVLHCTIHIERFYQGIFQYVETLLLSLLVACKIGTKRRRIYILMLGALEGFPIVLSNHNVLHQKRCCAMKSVMSLLYDNINMVLLLIWKIPSVLLEQDRLSSNNLLYMKYHQWKFHHNIMGLIKRYANLLPSFTFFGGSNFSLHLGHSDL